MKPKNPIIVVGPGRSGTTLLGAVLGEHPDFYMIGESQFLLHRLWTTFNEHSHYSNSRKNSLLAQQRKPAWREMSWWRFCEEIMGPRQPHDVSIVLEEIEKQENERVAREIGRAFALMMIPSGLRKKRWGFSDIWLGSDSFQLDTTLYEMAFPNAIYLQCVRHPFTYVNSIMKLWNVEFTDKEIEYNLSQWIKMTDTARRFGARSSYLEFKLEDFSDLDKGTASDIFQKLGLEMTDRCRNTFRVRHSKTEEKESRAMDKFVMRVAGLEDRMRELKYLF